jgi:hypothetical protein
MRPNRARPTGVASKVDVSEARVDTAGEDRLLGHYGEVTVTCD